WPNPRPLRAPSDRVVNIAAPNGRCCRRRREFASGDRKTPAEVRLETRGRNKSDRTKTNFSARRQAVMTSLRKRFSNRRAFLNRQVFLPQWLPRDETDRDN